MGFADWFTFGKKKNKDVNIQKVKRKSIDPGSMAAGSGAQAADAIAMMVDQTNAPTKVLMVQDGDYMAQVTDYALKMAQRLDCEIIALDVSDRPLQFAGERRARETDRFIQMAADNAEKFTIQAKAQGIKVEHVIEIHDPEEVIARVSSTNAGIRYVLSKPEEGTVRPEQERAHVPVFDLRCSRL